MSKELNDAMIADGGCGGACSCDGSQAANGLVTRRGFVAYGAAALAMAALAACGGDSLTSPSTVDSTALKLSDFPSLSAVGGVATTSIGRTPIAIVRTGTSSFSAFSRICPHQGSTINVTSTGFLCPNHGATFNKAGQWIGGERTSSLTSYPVTFDSTAGTITVG
jgi:nitrite reductase/ring-hydroxylating ferredoxin subunit